MKKIYSILAAFVAAMAILTSCSDVPMPYDINSGKENTFGKTLPYKSTNLNSNWDTFSVTNDNPWTMSSGYVSATGYQQWEGDTKTNREAEGYLISPAFCTISESGKVKLTFDHVIMYSSKDKDFKNHIALYVSKNYDGKNFNGTEEKPTTWEKIPFTIESQVTPSTTDWTCYTIPAIQLPDEYVNVDGVYFAFYFYAPSNNSVTWEIKNFVLMEGEASGTPNTPDAPEVAGTKESPLTVAQAKAMTGGTGYVGGYIVGYVDGTKLEDAKFEAADAGTIETEILLADSPDEINYENVFPVQLPPGDLRTMLNPNNADNIGNQVIVYGTFATYFGTNGMKETSWALFNGQTIGKDPDAAPTPMADPKGNGTLDNPFNVAGAIKYVQSLGTDVKSDKEMYVEGIVTRNITKDADITSYGNLTFFISDDGTENNEFEAYQVNGLNNKKVSETNYVKKGDKVILYGKILNFRGNTPETDGKGSSYIYSLNGNNGSDIQPEPEPVLGQEVKIEDDKVFITAEGNVPLGETFEIDLSSFDKANAAEMGTITTANGVEIIFDKGTNTNAPKYYDGTKGARVYPNNTITIQGSQKIARVIFQCDVYTDKNNVTTIYTGNTTAKGIIDGSTVVYNNYTPDISKENVQLRVQKIVISYEKTSNSNSKKR